MRKCETRLRPKIPFEKLIAALDPDVVAAAAKTLSVTRRQYLKDLQSLSRVGAFEMPSRAAARLVNEAIKGVLAPQESGWIS